MGTMHKGNLETNETLQKLREFLSKRGEAGATTAELASALDLQSASTWVSALRNNGVPIECRFEGISNRRRIYRYWLAQYAPKETA